LIRQGRNPSAGAEDFRLHELDFRLYEFVLTRDRMGDVAAYRRDP